MTCFKECIMNIFLCQELFFPSILKIYIGTFYLLFFIYWNILDVKIDLVMTTHLLITWWVVVACPGSFLFRGAWITFFEAGPCCYMIPSVSPLVYYHYL